MVTTPRGSILATCAALAVLATCPDVRTGVAQTKQPAPRKVAARQPPPTRPGDVDPRQSRIYVHVGKTGLGHEHGIEGRIKSGVIWLGVAKEAGMLVFDMQSLKADELDAREYVGLTGEVSDSTREKVTANMRGSSVLDTKKFPSATFEIHSSLPIPKQQPNSLPEYQLSGDFTLHGVTRRLEVHVQADAGDDMIRLRGRFPLLQTHFGIKPYSTALGAIGVADRLTIWGDVWVHAEPAKQAGASEKSSRR